MTESAVSLVAGPGRATFRFAVAAVLVILVLFKAGAMVTSTDSGMAFRDWPLANGSLWPPGMELPQLFEHLHRVIGAVAGLCSGILLWLVWRRDAPPAARTAAWLALGLWAAQALLGGLRVLLHDTRIGIPHAIVAQVYLCVHVYAAFALSPVFEEERPVTETTARGARRLADFALGAVFVQILVGAVARQLKLTGFLWLHVGLALFVALLTMVAALHSSRRFPVLTRSILAVLLLQLVLGFVALIVRLPTRDPSNIQYLGRSALLTAHVVVGALLSLSSALLAFRVRRNLVATRAA
jgi:heme A synthase